MLCERVLGNWSTDRLGRSSPARSLDYVDLHWWETDRRALRRNTRAAREIRILLALGESLRHDDILFDDGHTAVLLNLLPAEVLVVAPAGIDAMGHAGLIAGNLHVPAEVCAGEMLLAPDGPIEAALAEAGIAYRREARRFHPRRYLGMPVLQVSPQLEIRRERA